METSPASVPPPVVTSNEKTWCMLAHLSALVGFVIPFGSLLGPFLVWQIKKSELPAVEAHAKQALNFQISCIIYLIVCIPLLFVIIGFPLMCAIGIGNLVCVIIAALKANEAKPWSYPLTLKLLK